MLAALHTAVVMIHSLPHIFAVLQQFRLSRRDNQDWHCSISIERWPTPSALSYPLRAGRRFAVKDEIVATAHIHMHQSCQHSQTKQ